VAITRCMCLVGGQRRPRRAETTEGVEKQSKSRRGALTCRHSSSLFSLASPWPHLLIVLVSPVLKFVTLPAHRPCATGPELILLMLPVHQLVAVSCTSARVGGGRKGTSGGGRCVWSMPWRLANGGLGHLERNWAGWAREAEDEIGWIGHIWQIMSFYSFSFSCYSNLVVDKFVNMQKKMPRNT
jgi:hypothetical protein